MRIIIIIIIIISFIFMVGLYILNVYKINIFNYRPSIKNLKYYYDLSYPNDYYNDSKIANNINPIIQPIIPLYIFQTWHTKNLSEEMQETVNIIKRTNPEFIHILADMNDCYNFIKNNFSSEVADAYNKLIPLSYKSDLWRYCVLYKYGGIYLDIKFRPMNGFKFINIMDKEHYVLDPPSFWMFKNFNKNNQYGICSSLIISKPNNPILMECINQIVVNIKNNYYGGCSLEPTGPLLLGSKYILYKDITEIDMGLAQNLKNNFKIEDYIVYKNIRIFEMYKSYRSEQKKDSKKPHHSKIWRDRQIYKLN
jgi:hypothetical protein